MNNENCKCLEMATPQIESIKTLITDIEQTSEDIRIFTERLNGFVAGDVGEHNNLENIEVNCMLDAVRKINRILMVTKSNLAFLSEKLGM